MLETQRLILKPLTYSQVIKYINDDTSLEKELNLDESARNISTELKEALEETILPNIADETKNYLYSTLWTIISKAENKMVGDLCFKGEPDSVGEIEIGYGTYEDFRSKGYMTEAVGAMIGWAKTQPNVVSIFAATDKNNKASVTVLENNNFIKVGESETSFNWRLILRRL